MVKRPKPIKGIKKLVDRRHHKPTIKDVIKEATAGGIVYRLNPKGEVEILLVQDAKNRWTIPKGHIEVGEKPRDTAEREVNEETGLQEVDVQEWLGKINFQYRRHASLILMSTHIYLIEAKGDTDKTVKEDWMNSIEWFSSSKALDLIEYEDIAKLILQGLKKIREKKGN